MAFGRVAGVRIERPDLTTEVMQADAYLMCLGSYSPLFTRPVANAAKAYSVSLTDDEYKLVFSRLGDRLRIAGTAELNGYNTELNEVRCRAILRRTLELFPGGGDPARVRFWTGLRPTTPSNVPYIGATRYPNLYLSTGHGTLGWTHSCGSGRAIADIVSGRKPEVDFAFTGMRTPRGVVIPAHAA